MTSVTLEEMTRRRDHWRGQCEALGVTLLDVRKSNDTLVKTVIERERELQRARRENHQLQASNEGLRARVKELMRAELESRREVEHLNVVLALVVKGAQGAGVTLEFEDLGVKRD